jgi:hypothetical protein
MGPETLLLCVLPPPPKYWALIFTSQFRLPFFKLDQMVNQPGTTTGQSTGPAEQGLARARHHGTSSPATSD